MITPLSSSTHLHDAPLYRLIESMKCISLTGMVSRCHPEYPVFGLNAMCLLPQVLLPDVADNRVHGKLLKDTIFLCIIF